MYFDSTNGGPVGLGQIFALRPTATGGTLTLLAQSTSETRLNGPDNLVMAPWGDLVIAEDSLSGNGIHHLRGLTPEGEIYDLARTTRSELAGVCFSPDGRALFVNVYGSGHTLVITGTFPEVPENPSGGGGQGGQANEPGNAGQAGDGTPAEPAGGALSGASGEGGTPGDTDTGGAAGTGGSQGEAAGRGGATGGRGQAGGAGRSGAGGSAGGSNEAGGAGSGTAGAAGNAGGGKASAGSSGNAGSQASGAETTSPTEDSGDCSCRVGPGAQRADSSALLALSALAAAFLRRERAPSDD